jgi:hypothetical protein
MSRYAVAREIDLDQSTLSRFMSGKAGLSVKTIDKLCSSSCGRRTQRAGGPT